MSKMKKMSVYNFDKLIKALNPRRFVYDATCQKGYGTLRSRKDGKDLFIMQGVYDEIIVYWEQPKAIFFKTKDGANTLTLNGVKHILVPKDLTYAHIALEFTVACGNFFDESIETKFKFCADIIADDLKSVYLVPFPFLNAFSPIE